MYKEYGNLKLSKISLFFTCREDKSCVCCPPLLQGTALLGPTSALHPTFPEDPELEYEQQGEQDVHLCVGTNVWCNTVEAHT